MTPWDLLTNEGTNLDPVEISLHNYYNNSIASFGEYQALLKRRLYPPGEKDNFPY